MFKANSELLDAVILAVVDKNTEGTYGYKITHEISQVINVSESSLYPALRRLYKKEYIEICKTETTNGRNGTYYRITNSGKVMFQKYKNEWDDYILKINSILSGIDL